MLIEPQQEKSEEKRFFETIEYNEAKKKITKIIEIILELNLYFSLFSTIFDTNYDQLSNTQKELILVKLAKTLKVK